jgi:hypothetical protein
VAGRLPVGRGIRISFGGQLAAGSIRDGRRNGRRNGRVNGTHNY